LTGGVECSTTPRICHKSDSPRRRQDKLSAECQVCLLYHLHEPSQTSNALAHRFPKTYPTLACPTFIITKPIEGRSLEHTSKLTHVISAEAQRSRGSEMVFQVGIHIVQHPFVESLTRLVDCEFCTRVARRECSSARRSAWLACSANEPTGNGRRTSSPSSHPFPILSLLIPCPPTGPKTARRRSSLSRTSTSRQNRTRARRNIQRRCSPPAPCS
jgi:hypothetical protein